MDKIIIILLLLFSFTPLSAHAHTTLTSSNPTEGEVLQMQPEKLELVFGTIIEEGSSITLEGPDQIYEVGNISISGNTMTGSIEEELSNGPYIIIWNIIGEDGHPIEGQIPFSLNAEIVDEEPAAENETPEEAADETVAEQPAEESTEATESADNSQGNSGLLSTVLLVAAVILIGFVFFKLLKKKA